MNNNEIQAYKSLMKEAIDCSQNIKNYQLAIVLFTSRKSQSVYLDLLHRTINNITQKLAMTDLSISIFFFFAIFCFLTYSCTWFGRTLRNYQFEMARHQAQQANSQISIYTIERGIQRDSAIREPPPRYKDDLPPAYCEAIKMSLMNPTKQDNNNHRPENLTTPGLLPRRNSCTI